MNLFKKKVKEKSFKLFPVNYVSHIKFIKHTFGSDINKIQIKKKTFVQYIFNQK